MSSATVDLSSPHDKEADAAGSNRVFMLLGVHSQKPQKRVGCGWKAWLRPAGGVDEVLQVCHQQHASPAGVS